MSSPAICVADTTYPFSWESCRIHFFSKKATQHLNLFPSKPLDWQIQEERYFIYSDWAFNILRNYGVQWVGLEGYAYGSSSGLVFNIGESTGALKQIIWKAGIAFTVHTPSTIKKFATSKGNANKELMRLAFEKETGYTSLKQDLLETEKQNNPSSDIIDSYFIAKMIHGESSSTSE